MFHRVSPGPRGLIGVTQVSRTLLEISFLVLGGGGVSLLHGNLAPPLLLFLITGRPVKVVRRMGRWAAAVFKSTSRFEIGCQIAA